MPEKFDVFLSYHSPDQAVALQLAERLKARLIRIWVDNGELRPGSAGYRKRIEAGVAQSSSAIIAFGPSGTGEWQELEIDLCLQETAQREFSLIPLLLPGGQFSAIPPLLKSRFCVSDFSAGFENERAFELLEWGITGNEVPSLIPYTEVVEPSFSNPPDQSLDMLAMASIKAHVYRAAEEIAASSASMIAGADEGGESDLTRWVVLLTSLRWQRGYLTAFEKLFSVRRSGRSLRDFEFVVLSAVDPEIDGILGTVTEDPLLFITIDRQRVARVDVSVAEDAVLIERAINAYGRLGKPLAGSQSLSDRLGDIPIQTVDHADQAGTTVLYQNRAVLAPVVARYGMPGQEGFLPKPSIRGRGNLDHTFDDSDEVPDAAEKVLLSARRAVKLDSLSDAAEYREYARMVEATPALKEALRHIFGDDGPNAIRESWKSRPRR